MIDPPAFSYRTDPAVPPFPDDRPIIVFDGYRALCSGWARFVLKHDRHRRYRLLLAQSRLGHALYVHYGLDPHDYETNILIADGRAWYRSEGSIRMAEGLGFPWSLAAIFRILPRPLRDALYAAIARNRLRWFGKLEQCYLPAPTDRDRFIDGGPAAARAPLFARLLGEAWEKLPPALREMHFGVSCEAEGRAEVVRGKGLLASIAGAFFRFPLAGVDVPLVVRFDVTPEREVWQRNFAGRRFVSTQSGGKARSQRLLLEKFGSHEFGIALALENGRLRFIVRRWRFLGIALPASWAPVGESFEFESDGVFHFHVEIRHPLGGLLVRYTGSLSQLRRL